MLTTLRARRSRAPSARVPPLYSTISLQKSDQVPTVNTTEKLLWLRKEAETRNHFEIYQDIMFLTRPALSRN